jgi:hypothetical protein
MKKLLLLTIMIVLMGVAGYSQVFEKKSQAINIDMGFGNVNYVFDSYYSGFLPSVSVSYEYGIVRVPMGSKMNGILSVGGYMAASMSYYGPEGYDPKEWRRSNFVMAARCNYHFVFHDRFDPYAGFAVGVNYAMQKYIGDNGNQDVDDPGVKPFAGIYAGARWYFTDNFAVNAEVGWLISVANIGVTFKFGNNN